MLSNTSGLSSLSAHAAYIRSKLIFLVSSGIDVGRLDCLDVKG